MKFSYKTAKKIGTGILIISALSGIPDFYGIYTHNTQLAIGGIFSTVLFFILFFFFSFLTSDFGVITIEDE